MDNDRYYQLGSHDKLFNQIDELTDALASRDAEIAKIKNDNEYLYVAAIERDQLKERLDLLIESGEMLASELDELRLDANRYKYLTREGRSRDFIIPALERKSSIDAAIDKVLLSATKHHDRS